MVAEGHRKGFDEGYCMALGNVEADVRIFLRLPPTTALRVMILEGLELSTHDNLVQ